MNNHFLDKNNIPKHVAIIMDGNGRWAKQKGEMRIFGHTNGVESVRESLTAAAEIGVKYLTLYAFSTENWNRPKEEVAALMDLLVKAIYDEVEELNEKGVRLETIGNTSILPVSCREALTKAKERTKNNDKITLILALSYSSRWEIAQAVKTMAEESISGKLDVETINEDLISSYLSTSNFPDPELLIRTSGENRVSNFLMWQLAYTELYFTETLWPDFKKEHFFKAIKDYQDRERRFGKTSEQIVNE
ncbi:MAG: isoprenyl transferase [Bacteroidota bacterium]|nr:isoprenyl transferase [Bacteroidota bacterium]MEC7062670.1 isoprenyl transferase [Bacteroidota bacterium]MEC7954817.1 isoprenyl transferase [Bacteroidota bacterium]MED6303335.1 isoprenyl transferase [Bacteroidota bacterium]GIR59990.1 MAG: isoprenyl transferase [Crocinitomicaceae bacterium]|tara:strand:+ start:676 stop:1419 length:744 start_codon:yes stop_codon:yes gene_type:complete